MREEMLQRAKKVMKNAYAPYSKFRVGTCLLTETKQLFEGCNVENASYGLVQCSEASALANMVIHMGYQKIIEVVLISDGDKICAPCGACRQRFREFAIPGMLVHMYGKDDEHLSMTLEELLPQSFGPEHLSRIVYP